MCVARAFVANQAQRLPSPVNQRQPAREILVVIKVLPEVDPVDGTVFGLRGEVPLSMPAGLLPPSGARMRYPFRRRPKVIELIVRHQSNSRRTSPSDAYRHGRTAASPRSASMVILVVLRQWCERHGRWSPGGCSNCFHLLFHPGTNTLWFPAEDAGEPRLDVHAFTHRSTGQPTGQRQGTHQAPATLGDETHTGTTACANAPPLRRAEPGDRGPARPRRAGIRAGSRFT